jgi:hypothetical protein
MKLVKVSGPRTLALALLILIIGGVLLAAVIRGTVVTPQGGTLEHYASAPVSKPSRDAAIAAMEQLTNPGEVISPQGLQVTLGTSNLPSQDPVVKYLQTLANFSANLQEIRSGLQVAQTSVTSGDQNNAIMTLNHLVAVRNETGTLIDTLYRTLNSVQTEPNVNQNQIQDIKQRVDELRRIYIEYSIEIDQLKAELNPRTASLSISTQNNTVFVEQPLRVNGRLQMRNGTVLPMRNVTITWSTNRTTTVTDSNGTYAASIDFLPGAFSGPTVIAASFQPNGSDAAQFVPTSASAVIQLVYYPTRLDAKISPRLALPLDTVSVTGNLTTLPGIPLENRSLHIQLDNSPIGNVTTETGGVFLYTFQVPSTVLNGNHSLQVSFSPNAEIFAPSTSTTPLIVQRETVNLQAKPSPSSLLSGFTSTVNGVVTFSNKTSLGTFHGNVTVLLDGVPYGSSTVGDDGAFSIRLPVPLSASFGRHSVDIVYVPFDPRVDSATNAMPIYVYNTLILAIVAAVAVFGPQPLLIARRRRRTRRVKSQVTALSSEEAMAFLEEVEARPPLLDWEGGLRALGEEMNASRKIAICYRLAQIFFSKQLNERVRDTETHWELYRRIVGLNPRLEGDLKSLAELFELAEYSPFRIRASQGDEAERRFLKIREANSA